MLDPAGLDVRTLVLGKQLRPGLGKLDRGSESRPTAQFVAISISNPPTVRGFAERTQPSQREAVVVEPRPEARPRADQRLMGNFDGRLTCCPITEHLDHRARYVRQVSQLGPAAGVGGTVAQQDQPDEQTLGSTLGIRLESAVNRFGLFCQRTRDSAQRSVGRQRHARAVATIEQLSQGELQQRQASRLDAHIGDDLIAQSRLDAGPSPACDNGRS